MNDSVNVGDTVVFLGFGRRPVDARVTAVHSTDVVDLEIPTTPPQPYLRVARSGTERIGAFAWHKK